MVKKIFHSSRLLLLRRVLRKLSIYLLSIAKRSLIYSYSTSILFLSDSNAAKELGSSKVSMEKDSIILFSFLWTIPWEELG